MTENLLYFVQKRLNLEQKAEFLLPWGRELVLLPMEYPG